MVVGVGCTLTYLVSCVGWVWGGGLADAKTVLNDDERAGMEVGRGWRSSSLPTYCPPPPHVQKLGIHTFMKHIVDLRE